MSKLDEMIVVAPRRLVFDDETNTFHGFLPLADPRTERILKGLAERPRQARRGDVEEDCSLLQPIPYVAIVRETAAAAELFAYTRLSGGGEKRLHGRISIGTGGHMNRTFDLATLRAVVDREAARELDEELAFRDGTGSNVAPPPARLVGLINDDTGDVQRVHLGLLAMIELPADWQVEVRETERLQGRWTTARALSEPELAPRLEEWSRHAMVGLSTRWDAVGDSASGVPSGTSSRIEGHGAGGSGRSR